MSRFRGPAVWALLLISVATGAWGCTKHYARSDGTGDLARDRYTGERLPATTEEARAWGYPHED